MLQAIAFSIGYGLGAALLLFALRATFADVFSDEPEVVQSTVAYLAISVWGYAGFGVLITVNGALNAVDRASNALALSLTRVLLVMVPLAWLLRAAYGTQAIFAAELAANLLGGLAAAFLAWRAFGRKTD